MYQQSKKATERLNHNASQWICVSHKLEYQKMVAMISTFHSDETRPVTVGWLVGW
jgi:hypothetical protein